MSGTDISRIGFEADTSALNRASKGLDNVATAAGKSQRATDAASSSFDKNGRATSKLSSELDRATAAENRATRATTQLNGQMAAGATIANRFTGAMSLLRAAFAGLAIGALLTMFQTLTNTYTDLNSRVRLASGSMEAGVVVMGRLEEMARRTYSPLQQTAETYLLNANALRELGYSTEGTLQFVEAMNNALVVSGTKGQRAESVVYAISKAMSTGSLQGDELNTVLANGGRIAQALAKHFGVSTVELRKLGSEGKITGKALYEGLTSELEKLRVEADSMPATIGDAFVLIGNSILGFVGRLDQASGLSAFIATRLVALADTIKGATDWFLRAGQIIGAVLAPAFSLLASNMDTIQIVAQIALAALGGFAAPALIAGVAALTWGIGVGMVAAVDALTVAMLMNPLGVFIGAIAAVLVAAFMFRDKIKSIFGVDIVEVFRAGANILIGSFDLAFKNIGTIWSMLPNVLGDVVISTAQFVTNGVESMINASISLINDMLWQVKDKLAWVGITVDAKLGDVEFGDIENPFAGKIKDMGDALANNTNIVAATDYVGALGAMIDGLGTSTTETTTEVVDLTKTLGDGTVPALNDASAAAKKLEDQFKKTVEGANEFIAGQELERAALGMTAQAASEMRHMQELLNSAQAGGVTVSGAQRAALSALSLEMARQETATEQLSAAYEFGKSTFSAFFADVNSNLREGKTVWESFADAGLNALNKIADKLLGMAADGIFDMLFNLAIGAVGGGGGGGVGSGIGKALTGILGGVAKGWAAGGYTGDMNASKVAGVVHGQEFVVNAAATARNLPMLQAINDNAPMPRSAAQSGNGSITINAPITISVPPGSNVTIAEVRALALEIINETLPDALRSVQSDPRKRLVRAA